MIMNFLEIHPAIDQHIFLRESMTHETYTAVNKIWYRGRADELDQMYKQLVTEQDYNTRFWAAAPVGMKVRKIHTGLPKIMINKLAEMVSTDIQAPKIGEGADDWAVIEKTFDLSKSVEKALKKALPLGDGAWKISVDSSLSQTPIIEFYGADRVEFEYSRGVINGVRFFTTKTNGTSSYKLCERYKKNSVSYTLYGMNGKEVPLDTLDDLKDLKPVTFEGNYMMAVPLIITESEIYEGRGTPIWEGKLDNFDALDEIVSQWVDAIRAGRVLKYIPEDMIPRDAEGNLKEFNAFGSNFLKIEKPNQEGIDKKIEVDQPEIDYESYLHTYASILDLCLQGIISPATLGIDLSKISSADAQREKKDITSVTRGTITDALEKAVADLINCILATYDTMRKRPVRNYGATVTFGEYGAPTFEAKIDAVGKAATSNIMSVETQVEELWGDSKDENWKRREANRIKQMKGIEVVDEPKTGGELIDLA